MKHLLIGFSAAALLAGSAQAAVVTEKQNRGIVRLARGEPLTLILEANGTTGYEWQIVERPRNLKRVSQTYLSLKQAPGAPAAVGAGGRQQFTFKPLAKGRGTLRLVYRQSWNGGDSSADTYRLTVITR